MKKLILITLTTILGLAACGPTKSDALKDYKGLNGSQSPNDGSNQVYVDKEVLKIVEKPVEKIVYVQGEVDQLVIDGNNFEITFDNNNIKFVEGMTSSFQFKVRILKGQADFKVNLSKIDGQLELVKKEASEATYKLTWMPKFGTIPTNVNEADGEFTLTMSDVKFNSGDAAQDKIAQEGFELAIKTRDVPFVVRRTNTNPTIKVNGLNVGTRRFNEVTPFTVDVTAPGTYEGFEPKLLVLYDRTNAMTDKGLEAKGSLYVDIDMAHPKAEKIADNTYRFFFVFDTKNNPVLPQYDKELKEVLNPTALLAHVTFQAITEFGTSDKQTVHLNIAFPNESGK